VTAYLDVVHQIAAVRVRNGLTQTQVARRMRVSASGISAIERGYRSPNLSTLLRYASACGATITIGEKAA
jgi:transcriptional regulator with XRE-family HTH domain